MTKIKTAELTGAALDWAVAIAMGWLKQIAITDYGDGQEEVFFFHPVRDDQDEVVHAGGDRWKPSTDWSVGGPIIEREGISIDQRKGEPCRAFIGKPINQAFAMFAPHGEPLTAAMLCFVASRLGDEVDVPDELIS